MGEGERNEGPSDKRAIKVINHCLVAGTINNSFHVSLNFSTPPHFDTSVEYV